MRLLKIVEGNGFELTKDFEDEEIPPYTILSHTWESAEEEVTFKDLGENLGRHKKGYRKLEFCAAQAGRDGETHFWVDTCCIDKSNSVELNTAITSMFNWYQRAVKCYVYLSDVHCETLGSDFPKSRWLRRGWTLQELLAPEVVEFFDNIGTRLGDKTSLERQICAITGIPAAALRGRPLSSFSIEEKFSWQASRRTTKPEDQAYSLLGICGVSMIPIYGEGKDKAMARLRREIDEFFKGAKHQDYAVSFSLAGVPECQTFLAREVELERTHRCLCGGGGRRTVVLQGLGGIGKTQLALAYAKRHKDSYSAIFWLNIQDETSVKQSFAKMAKRVLQQHPTARWLSVVDMDGDLNKITEAVLAWLSEPDNTRWLAIYDNYDNPKIPGTNHTAAVDIERFLPEAHQGSVIITTRFSDLQRGQCIQVQKLTSVQESTEMLSSYSERTLSTNDPAVLDLVRKLDGLPLALATAGSYLRHVTMSVAHYLHQYEASWLQLQQTSPGLHSYEDRMLYSTWQISLDHIQQRSELSANLLGLWAYFDHRDLWFELLRDGSFQYAPWVEALTPNELTFHKALRLLCNYGLVEMEASSEEALESGGYSIHSCVHAWSMHVINREWSVKSAMFAVDAVGRQAGNQYAIRPWVTQRRLLQHAARCLQHVQPPYSLDTGVEQSLTSLGVIFIDQGKLAGAETVLIRALSGLETALGAEHEWTLDAMNKLGIVYRAQGRLEEAEVMYQRVLRGYEKMGREHPAALDTVSNLGNLYASQEKTAEAEEMYMRALKGYENASGEEDPSTLGTINNLGALYERQHRFTEADALYQRALHGYHRTLGAQHPSTLGTISNLGILYEGQGRMEEAEAMYEQALRGYEDVLGEDHTSALEVVNNLGALYRTQGRLEEAEASSTRALRGFEKALGAEHKSTLEALGNLGLVYEEQGKTVEAEEMFVRALRGKEKVLGRDHTSTLNIVNNLANLYVDGRSAEAEEMYVRALKGFEKSLGAEHASTLQALNNLGRLQAEQGRLAEAEGTYTRALTTKEKVLGRDHPSTLDTANNLGLLYAGQGRRSEAEAMYKRALGGYEKAFGEAQATPTLDVVNNLGILYYSCGDRLEESEALFLQALKGYERALGATHVSTLDTAGNLAILYKHQGRVAEEEGMLERVLRGREERLGAEHTATLDTVKKLGVVYHSQGRLAEAEAMCERALRGTAKALGPEDQTTTVALAAWHREIRARRSELKGAKKAREVDERETSSSERVAHGSSLRRFAGRFRKK